MAAPEAPARLSGRVLVTWIDFDADGETTGARLRAAGLDVECAPKLGARRAADVAALAAGAVGAIVSTDPFDAGVFAVAPQLRVVARVGVGTDSIDLDAATAAGVAVMITPGANRETAADHAVAMMLAALRRIVEHDGALRRGEWRRGGDLTPWDLHGTTVGLVGFGSIGRAVAERLRGFGVRLVVADPALRPGDVDAPLVGLDRLLAEADVVSLHLPLSAGTRRLIGAAELDRLRPGAVLVNTSRGGLVDETALARRLRDGRLRAAALDVFLREPDVPEALRRLPNVVLTPHIGGLSVHSVAAMTEQATTHVLDALQGRPQPSALANPEVLERLRPLVAS
jgi:phosphoglycerate dehydrogenase-like enzyme